MAKESYYDLLGVSERATEAQIRVAYRKLAQKYHPDVNTTAGAEAKFTKINVAYSVLSDSLKRADYDQELSAEVVRRPAPETSEAADEEGFAHAPVAEAPTRSQYAAAFSRVAISALAGLITGAVAQYVALARVGGNHAYGFVWGPIAGLVIAGIWSTDVNFRVETFIGEGRTVRVVSFLRTVGLALSLGYAGALLLSFVAQSVHANRPLYAAIGLTLGVIVGATYGSDGEGWQKLTSDSGRFELFYAMLRAGSVGLIGGAMGFLIGGTLELLGAASVIGWLTLGGGLLGFILGAVSPANLSAYASYVSASVRSTLFFLSILATLFVGVLWGTLYGRQTFELIARLFHH